MLFADGNTLFASDGTLAGTKVLMTVGNLGSYVPLGNKVLITAPGATSGIYVSDGSGSAPNLITIPGLKTIQGNLTVVGTNVVFEGTDASGKQALFQSDGTAAGSKELALPAGVAVDSSTVIAPLAIPTITPPPTVPGGSGVIILGNGPQTYSAAAGATVQAGSGSDTITASAGGVLVVASAGILEFLNGTGPSTVSGGAGSATIFGGTGGGNYTGGSAGHNVLIAQGAAGANTTLTGAAAGDQLFGSGRALMC